MRRVMVCDFGVDAESRCENVAQFLEQELPIEVLRMADMRDLRGKTNWEVMEIAVEMMTRWIEGVEVEVVVLLSPLVTVVALERLRAEFPRRKIMGYGQGMAKMAKELKRVFLLTPQRIRRLELYQRMKAECQEVEINEPDCQKWRTLAERGWLAKEEAIAEMKMLRGAKVVIYDPEILRHQQKMKEMVGWRGEVTDMREEMLVELKRIMGMEG